MLVNIFISSASGIYFKEPSGVIFVQVVKQPSHLLDNWVCLNRLRDGGTYSLLSSDGISVF